MTNTALEDAAHEYALDRFAYSVVKENFIAGANWQSQQTIDAVELIEIDDILAYFEDFTHGEDGKKITQARHLIKKLIEQPPQSKQTM